MQFAPDGRLFICQQTRRSFACSRTGPCSPRPSCPLTVDSSGERGLLGVAFDPDFATNQFVYVYYTSHARPSTTASAGFTANGDVAAAGSEVVILELNNLSGATNHNGGALHFGPDGKLYVAVGENANGNNAQIADEPPGQDAPHQPRRHASRPTTRSSDRPRATTGRSGRSACGTPSPSPSSPARAGCSSTTSARTPGRRSTTASPARTTDGRPPRARRRTPAFRSPALRVPARRGQSHRLRDHRGAFYNPTTVQFPADYIGDYFFADFCGGWIWRYDPASGRRTQFATGISSPVDLKVTDDGSLFYLARGQGRVYRVQNMASQAPVITCPTSSVPASGSYSTIVQCGQLGHGLGGAIHARARPTTHGSEQWKYVPLPRPATVTMTAPGTAGSVRAAAPRRRHLHHDRSLHVPGGGAGSALSITT